MGQENARLEVAPERHLVERPPVILPALGPPGLGPSAAFDSQHYSHIFSAKGRAEGWTNGAWANSPYAGSEVAASLSNGLYYGRRPPGSSAAP